MQLVDKDPDKVERILEDARMLSTGFNALGSISSTLDNTTYQRLIKERVLDAGLVEAIP